MARPTSDQKLSQYYKDMQASEAGAHVFADLLALGNVYSAIESVDPIEAARCEGERRLALRIVEMLSLRESDFVTHAQGSTDLLENLLRASPDHGQLGPATSAGQFGV